MRFWVSIVLVIIFIYSCNSSKTLTKNEEIVTVEPEMDTIRIVNEELEYELIILDIGFDSWLVTQKPMSYYSNQTLQYKNYLYVIEWNNRVTQPFKYDPSLYENTINYDQNIDYGIELNYKLYQYFQFFQQKYKQNLL